MRERNPIPAVAVVGAFVVSLFAIPFLVTLELRAYDARLGLRRDVGWPEDLVLMEISRERLASEALAPLLEELTAAGAKTIAIDATIDEPSSAESESEDRLLAALSTTVLAVPIAPSALRAARSPARAFVTGAPPGPPIDHARLLMPPEARQIRAAGMGQTAATPDADGVFRRTDPFLWVDEARAIPSLPLVALAAHRGRDPTSYRIEGRALLDLVPGSMPRAIAPDDLSSVAGALVVLHVPREDQLPSPLATKTPGGLLFAAAVRTFDLGQSPRVIGGPWPGAVLFAIGVALALWLGRQPRAKRALAFAALGLAWIALAITLVPTADVFLPLAWPLTFVSLSAVVAAIPK